jgi:hypothetical protein
MKQRTKAIIMAGILITTIFSTVTVNGSSVDYVYRKTTVNASSQTNTDLLEDHYAVVVGISDYPSSINDLPSLAIEVKNMKDILCNNGWVTDNIVLLRNVEAKRQGILDALDWLSQKTGTVMFFFLGKVTTEKVFEYSQPRAVLEMAIGLGYPLAVIGIIKAAIEGEATLFEVIYILTVMGLTLPIPQMFDGNPSSEIVVIQVSPAFNIASVSSAK